jgi:hypothetical protein
MRLAALDHAKARARAHGGLVMWRDEEPELDEPKPWAKVA